MKAKLENIQIDSDVVIKESIYDLLQQLKAIPLLDIFDTDQETLFRTVNAILSVLLQKPEGV